MYPGVADLGGRLGAVLARRYAAVKVTVLLDWPIFCAFEQFLPSPISQAALLALQDQFILVTTAIGCHILPSHGSIEARPAQLTQQVALSEYGVFVGGSDGVGEHAGKRG